MSTKEAVTREQWLKARLELLKLEKAHSRARDEVTKARQALPWVKVEKRYTFDGPEGRCELADLFGSKNQLIVHHFMFDPTWSEGCKSCSFSADHWDRSAVHLAQRDVAIVAVSKAPLEKLESFKQRMGWSFHWVSSAPSDFNRDFHVSFTEEERASNTANYNYKENGSFVTNEAPGFSVFARNADGEVFHTYSVYGRGLEDTIGAYNLLDMVPKGRDEDGLPYGMYWLRLKDQYEDAVYQDPYA